MMLSKVERLAEEQGRQWVTAQQYLKVLRRQLPEIFKVRFANTELKSLPECELVLAIIGQAWTDYDDAFFFDKTSMFSGYANLLELNAEDIRKDFEKHCKAYFFNKHRGM